VSSLNPLDGIEVAITHLPLGTKPDSEEAKDPLNPHQRITLEQALRAYTLGTCVLCVCRVFVCRVRTRVG
jgi:predicted amidohydrolase YtcJ